MKWATKLECLLSTRPTEKCPPTRSPKWRRLLLKMILEMVASADEVSRGLANNKQGSW